MQPNDWIFWIIVIIFFIGPLIKKIVEGLSGGGAPAPKRASRESVQQYLERMRQEQAAAQPKAAVRQPQASKSPQLSKGRAHPKRAESKKPQEAIYVAVNGVEEKVAQQVPASQSVADQRHVPARKSNAGKGIQEKIMAHPRFTDLQKAIVLHEIFQKPKAYFGK